MKILITGCCGYIGSMLTPYLLSKGYSVVGVDNCIYDNIGSIAGILGHKYFTFVKSDIRNLNNYKEYIPDCKVIIPLAAIVGATACDRDPTLAYDTNFLAIESLINSLGMKNRVIFANTNSGYGIKSDKIYCSEEESLNPISSYGRSKCMAEGLVLTHENSVTLRLATVFGASYRPRFDLLVNNWTAKLYYDGEINVFEPGFNRNFIHIKDICRVFYHFIRNKDLTGIYNVGNTSLNRSKKQLAYDLISSVGGRYYESEGKDQDQRNYLVSNDKLEATGFECNYSLFDGVFEIKDICQCITKERAFSMSNA